MPPTLVAYWGSHFKKPNHPARQADLFHPFVREGWRIYLVCSRPPEDESWLAPLLQLGVKIIYSPRVNRNFSAAGIFRAYKLCRRVRCEVFLCDNMHTSPLIGAMLAGVPVRLWTKHSMQPVFEACREPTIRDRAALSVRVSCLMATRTLVESKATRDELLGLGVPASKVLMFKPYAPPMQLPNRDEARARLGYRDDELLVSTVGHAVPVKGWDILLLAFSKVVARFPQTRLMFVGSISADHERVFYAGLTRFMNCHGLGSYVRFTGHLPDITPVLAATDLFVMPSRSEGFSIALVEGLTAQLPCIATRVGIAPEIIRHRVNGLLVERQAPQELADAMLSLTCDSTLRHRLREATRAPIELPTFEEYRGRWFKLVSSFLSEHSSGR